MAKEWTEQEKEEWGKKICESMISIVELSKPIYQEHLSNFNHSINTLFHSFHYRNWTIGYKGSFRFRGKSDRTWNVSHNIYSLIDWSTRRIDENGTIKLKLYYRWDFNANRWFYGSIAVDELDFNKVLFQNLNHSYEFKNEKSVELLIRKFENMALALI